MEAKNAHQPLHHCCNAWHQIKENSVGDKFRGSSVVVRAKDLSDKKDMAKTYKHNLNADAASCKVGRGDNRREGVVRRQIEGENTPALLQKLNLY